MPNFRILTQVVAEKFLTEQNVHMHYIRLEEGKLEKEDEKRKNILISFLHSILCLPEGVHKI